MILLCAFLLLFSNAYVLKWHVCTCVPGKRFCVCDLYWIGQLGCTYLFCPMFLHVFRDYPINSLAGIFTALKRVVTCQELSRVTYNYVRFLAIIRILLQIILGIFHLWCCRSFEIFWLILPGSQQTFGSGLLPSCSFFFLV